MTLSIYQPDTTINMTQVFNKEVKSLMTLNNPAIPHNGVVSNQETEAR